LVVARCDKTKLAHESATFFPPQPTPLGAADRSCSRGRGKDVELEYRYKAQVIASDVTGRRLPILPRDAEKFLAQDRNHEYLQHRFLRGEDPARRT
jgi:hypothetical protein